MWFALRLLGSQQSGYSKCSSIVDSHCASKMQITTVLHYFASATHSTIDEADTGLDARVTRDESRQKRINGKPDPIIDCHSLRRF